MSKHLKTTPEPEYETKFEEADQENQEGQGLKILTLD